MAGKKRELPKAALAQMMSAAEEASKQSKHKTATEIFKWYLRLMDKYSDYFFNEPWPKKFDYKRVTTFTSEDLDFINANDDEFVERVMTVVMKKNVSFEGFGTKGGFFWTR